jgi:hypothetical protein
MIVEPDFLDHWKTRELVRLTGDAAAPLMLIRLWSHCHHRKTSRFLNLSDLALSGICQWTKQPQELRAILVELCLIEQRDNATVVHGWDECNRMLVSAWKNGQKGGRPRKNRPVNRPVNPIPVSGKPGLSNLSNLSSLKEGDSKGKPKDQKQVEGFCASIGLPSSEGEYFWNKWQGNGFQNAGKVMKDWRATIRSWKAAGHCPSQKHSKNDPPPTKRETEEDKVWRKTFYGTD